MERNKEGIEIGLELFRGRFFDEQDLLAVIEGLGIDEDEVHRMRNDFEWVSA